MMQKLFFFVLLIFCATFLTAQTIFQKTYGNSGNEVGYSIHQTRDSGFVISGLASDQKIFTLKTKSNGDTVWSKKYYFTGMWAANAQTTDGGYIIAGYASDQVLPCNDFRLIKTDSSGNILWTNIYLATRDVMNVSVIQTKDGGYMIAGTTDSSHNKANQNYDMMIVKTDANGALQWSKNYGATSTTSSEYLKSIQQTNDNGYLLAGSMNNSYAYVVKVDSMGSVIWSKTYGGVGGGNVANDVKTTTDGGFIIAGGTISFGAGSTDMYLIKADAVGNLIWSKTIGGSGAEVVNSIHQTNDGGYIAVGQTTSFGAGNTDVLIAKLDAAGTLLWTKTYGGTGDDRAYNADLTFDNGCIIIGYTSSFGAGAYDIYVIKTDINGVTNCNQTSPSAASATAATIVTPTITPERNWGGLGNDIPFVIPMTSPALATNTNCISLPVDWLYFVAELKNNLDNNQVLLKWSTNNEINVNYFEVERFDNRWESISKIKASNVTTSANSYQFADPISNHSKSDILYRIKQVDLNGAFNYSKIAKVNIKESAFGYSFNIYPNPTAGLLKIDFGNSSKSKSIVISDVFGKFVKKLITSNSSVEVDLQNYAKGVYLLQITTGQVTLSSKIILQ